MNWISTLLGNLNYGTILLLMLLESTVIPVPSELVVAPAAFHAHRAVSPVSVAVQASVAIFSTTNISLSPSLRV